MPRYHVPCIAATLLLGTTVACLAAPLVVDPVTGLAVYPGVTSIDKLPKPQHYCGKQMEMSDAIVPANARLPAVVAWYQANLSGAKHLQIKPGAGSNRAQDTFLMPDGLREVTITGTPNSELVYAVTYGRFSSALTPKEFAGFSFEKPSCGS